VSHFDMGRAVRNQEKLARSRRAGTKQRVDRARSHGDSEVEIEVECGICDDCGSTAPLLNLGDKKICDACDDASSIDRHLAEGLRGVGSQALLMGFVAVVATAVSVLLLPGKLELGMVLVVLAVLSLGFGYRAWRSSAQLRFTEGVLDVPERLVWYVRLAAIAGGLMAMLSAAGIVWQFVLPLLWAYAS
jgi:hypothetical protein